MTHTIESIGVMRCDNLGRYETPRQPLMAGVQPLYDGVIELHPGQNFEQALVGLDGFSHIWVLFLFHQNPMPSRPVVMIQPPRRLDGKIGVFATRSPHRPNGMGLSCLQLTRIEGRRVYVKGVDLLDGTPIFDIKPYVATYDAIPEASVGWLSPDVVLYDVSLTSDAKDRCDWLAAQINARLDRYAIVQLQEHPLDTRRKRIERVKPDAGVLHFRDWRIHYEVDEAAQTVLVTTMIPADTASESAENARLIEGFWSTFGG